jgi:hypothetical protein
LEAGNVFGIQKPFQIGRCGVGRIELGEWWSYKKKIFHLGLSNKQM